MTNPTNTLTEPAADTSPAPAGVHMTLITMLLDHRDVRRATTDINAMHQLVMSLYPDHPDGRAGLHVLYRTTIDQPARQATILAQATVPANLPALDPRTLAVMPQTRDITPLLDRIETGTAWRFQITANPTVSVNHGPDRRGTRIPLVGTDRQAEWITRRLAENGLQIAESDYGLILDTTGPELHRGFKGPGVRPIEITTVTFTGTATITDSDAARQAVITGIGRGKAYGAGLLTIAPLS